MRVIRSSSEEEMIAEYLRQERASYERYGRDIDRSLARVGASPTLVTLPDLTKEDDNRARREVFGFYRGYGQPGPSFFTGFPAGCVDWVWAGLSPDDVLSTLFTHYWAGIWEGSRLPRDLASRIREGRIPAWTERDPVLERLGSLVEAISGGQPLPPLILVTADDGTTRVVMEGHTRLTAYALAEPALPSETVVLLGRSPGIAKWDEY